MTESGIGIGIGVDIGGGSAGPDQDEVGIVGMQANAKAAISALSGSGSSGYFGESPDRGGSLPSSVGSGRHMDREHGMASLSRTLLVDARPIRRPGFEPSHA